MKGGCTITGYTKQNKTLDREIFLKLLTIITTSKEPTEGIIDKTENKSENKDEV